MSIVLPREPRAGDIFTGQIVHYHSDGPGLTISSYIPLYLPLGLLKDHITQPEILVGRWLECEVVEVVLEKRAVVVRLIAWLDNDTDIRASQSKTFEYWYPGLFQRQKKVGIF